ncbi:hypothetical protein VPH35_023530 [Triticum aestivum]
MASPSSSPQKEMMGRPASRDRLSDLPDTLLGHVLSFLPNKEAGRAAGLSRRWRGVFCNVHAISFEERWGTRANDWVTFYHEAEEKKSCSGALLDDVCSALLCRHRTVGHHVPLRSFRFAFDQCHHWNFVHVDQWLIYMLRHGHQELHLDLRFSMASICNDEAVDSGTDNTDDEDELFTCRVIRTLCVAYCRLKLPAAASLPLLETLSITAPHSDGGRSIQRLISDCPRLVDLTLEAVHRLKRVSVLDQRLRRFALCCCHNMKSIDIDASELRSLDYCGTVPTEPLLSLHGLPGVPSCTVDFCKVLPEDAGFTGFRVFMQKITTVVSVGRILEQTPNPEVLSLYMEEHVVYTKKKDVTMGMDLEDNEDDAVEKENDADGSSVAPDEEAMVLDESSFSMPCLRHRVKEINMVHYMGDETQRMMARLLFGNALVLERMCVVLVKGTLALQSKLKNEIESWLVADAEKVFL